MTNQPELARLSQISVDYVVYDVASGHIIQTGVSDPVSAELLPTLMPGVGVLFAHARADGSSYVVDGEIRPRPTLPGLPPSPLRMTPGQITILPLPAGTRVLSPTLGLDERVAGGEGLTLKAGVPRSYSLLLMPPMPFRNAALEIVVDADIAG